MMKLIKTIYNKYKCKNKYIFILNLMKNKNEIIERFKYLQNLIKLEAEKFDDCK